MISFSISVPLIMLMQFPHISVSLFLILLLLLTAMRVDIIDDRFILKELKELVWISSNKLFINQGQIILKVEV